MGQRARNVQSQILVLGMLGSSLELSGQSRTRPPPRTLNCHSAGMVYRQSVRHPKTTTRVLNPMRSSDRQDRVAMIRFRVDPVRSDPQLGAQLYLYRVPSRHTLDSSFRVYALRQASSSMRFNWERLTNLLNPVSQYPESSRAVLLKEKIPYTSWTGSGQGASLYTVSIPMLQSVLGKDGTIDLLVFAEVPGRQVQFASHRHPTVEPPQLITNLDNREFLAAHSSDKTDRPAIVSAIQPPDLPPSSLTNSMPASRAQGGRQAPEPVRRSTPVPKEDASASEPMARAPGSSPGNVSTSEPPAVHPELPDRVSDLLTPPTGEVRIAASGEREKGAVRWQSQNGRSPRDGGGNSAARQDASTTPGSSSVARRDARSANFSDSKNNSESMIHVTKQGLVSNGIPLWVQAADHQVPADYAAALHLAPSSVGELLEAWKVDPLKLKRCEIAVPEKGELDVRAVKLSIESARRDRAGGKSLHLLVLHDPQLRLTSSRRIRAVAELGLQPLLLSFSRPNHARPAAPGDTMTVSLHLQNDSVQPLPAGQRLVYGLVDPDHDIIYRQTLKLPAVEIGTAWKKSVELKLGTKTGSYLLIGQVRGEAKTWSRNDARIEVK